MCNKRIFVQCLLLNSGNRIMHHILLMYIFNVRTFMFIVPFLYNRGVYIQEIELTEKISFNDTANTLLLG